VKHRLLLTLFSSFVILNMIGCSSYLKVKPDDMPSTFKNAYKIPQKKKFTTSKDNTDFPLYPNTSYLASREQYETIKNTKPYQSDIKEYPTVASNTKKLERLYGGNFTGEDQFNGYEKQIYEQKYNNGRR